MAASNMVARKSTLPMVLPRLTVRMRILRQTESLPLPGRGTTHTWTGIPRSICDCLVQRCLSLIAWSHITDGNATPAASSSMLRSRRSKRTQLLSHSPPPQPSAATTIGFAVLTPSQAHPCRLLKYRTVFSSSKGKRGPDADCTYIAAALPTVTLHDLASFSRCTSLPSSHRSCVESWHQLHNIAFHPSLAALALRTQRCLAIAVVPAYRFAVYPAPFLSLSHSRPGRLPVPPTYSCAARSRFIPPTARPLPSRPWLSTGPRACHSPPAHPLSVLQAA